MGMSSSSSPSSPSSSSAPSSSGTAPVAPRRPRRRRGSGPGVAVGLAAALVLSACGADDDAPGADATHPGEPAPGMTTAAGPDGPAEATAPTYARYVALGDSFAALGPTAAPTTGPGACHRSTQNYAALLAERDDMGELVDVTCGGAETPDMTSPQIAETPPQFDALTADTDLVTLSIGGNDIGFGAIVECVATTERAQTGAPCRDRHEFDVTAALDELPAALDAVYDGIRARSPESDVVTTAYLPLVPAHGGCRFVSRMRPGDVTWIRHVTERINMTISAAAERAGAEVVLPDDAQERSACADPSVRYTDFTGIETGSHPMHPTSAGHRAMAEAVADTL